MTRIASSSAALEASRPDDRLAFRTLGHLRAASFAAAPETLGGAITWPLPTRRTERRR